MPTPRKKTDPFNPKARMTTRIRLGEDGQIVIPEKHRKALGVEPGDRMTISFVDGGLRITTWKQALARLQEEFRRRVPPGVSLVDELIAERRREAAREAAEDYRRPSNS